MKTRGEKSIAYDKKEKLKTVAPKRERKFFKIKHIFLLKKSIDLNKKKRRMQLSFSRPLTQLSNLNFEFHFSFAWVTNIFLIEYL